MKTITLTVTNDNIPEVDELFQLSITSLQLMDRSVNFNHFMNNIQINVPPLILQSHVNVTIIENDEPYGRIEFQQVQMVVHEGQGLVKIPVQRKGNLLNLFRAI